MLLFLGKEISKNIVLCNPAYNNYANIDPPYYFFKSIVFFMTTFPVVRCLSVRIY